MIHRSWRASPGGESAGTVVEVGAAVGLRDVVGVAVHGLLVGIVPLRGDLDGHQLVLGLEVEDVRVRAGPAAIQILNERLDAAVVLKHFQPSFGSMQILTPRLWEAMNGLPTHKPRG